MERTNENKSQLLNRIFSTLSVLMLIYFALPKITSSEVSLKGFSQFSPVLGLEPLSFMLFTGYMELVIAILFIVGMFLARRTVVFLWIANALLLSTMLSGLLIEFFARPKPVPMLVIIAVVFSAFAIIQLLRHSGSAKKALLATRA